MKRILELDILRALATILLVFHHSGLYQLELFGRSLKSLLLLPTTYALLGTFLLLSGYLSGLSSRQRDRRSLGGYYLRRLKRLYPPYLLALLLFAFLPGVRLKGIDLWLHILGLQILFAPIARPIFTLWYFGLVIACLIVVPLAIFLCKRPSQAIGWSLAAFLFLVYIHQRYSLVDMRLYYYFWIFAIGSLLGAYRGKVPLVFKPVLLVAALGVWIFTSVQLQQDQIVYYRRLNGEHIAWVNANILSFSYAAYGLATRIKRREWLAKAASFISRGSYFTYIYHRPVWGFLLLLIPAADRMSQFLMQFFVGIPLMFLMAGCLQPHYERAFLKRKEAA